MQRISFGFTKEETIQALRNKSFEVRKTFADAANASLLKGLNEEEAVFSGLSAVNSYERKIQAKNLKELQEQKELKKQQEIEKQNNIPLHLKLILEAKQQQAEIEKALEAQQDVVVQSVEIKDDYLIIKYSDETVKKLPLPYNERTIRTVVADNSLAPKPWIDFITSQTPAPDYLAGRVYWDELEHTLAVCTGVDSVTLQVGQEQYVRARNSTGSTILNGSVVYVSGSTGNRPNVSKAIASALHIAQETIGLTTHDIANNTDGVVTTSGLVRELNTSAFNDGDVLYLSASVSGGITNVKPTGANAIIKVGYCIRKHVSQGVILVSVANQTPASGTPANIVTKYAKSFTASDTWVLNGSNYEILVPADVHSLGSDIAFQVQKLEAGRYREILADDFSADENGNVRLVANASPDERFAGRILINTGVVIEVGSGVFSTKEVTANYTILTSDYTIRANTSSTDVILTLPVASSCSGQVFNIKKVSASNKCTILGQGIDLIDGEQSKILFLNYTSITVQSNGSTWDIL